MKYSIQMIVTLLRRIYEGSYPFLTIKSPYNRDGEPVTLVYYTEQFWMSKKKNKETGQKLITVNDILLEASSLSHGTHKDHIQKLVEELVKIGAVYSVVVDVNGKEIEKLVLTPLGLEIWRKLDDSPLFNQREVTIQDLYQMVNENLISQILEAQKAAWFDVYQGSLKSNSKKIFTPKMVCLGAYLCLNGAISEDNALYLTHTPKKDYQCGETLVTGLNYIARNLFGRDNLFMLPTLQDDFERRDQLAKNMGACFRWSGRLKTKDEIREIYWWEIGEYKNDPSILDHIIYTLVNRVTNYQGRDFPKQDELQPLKTRLETLINFFCHKVDNQLSTFEMSVLFPNQPNANFVYALQASIGDVLTKFDVE